MKHLHFITSICLFNSYFTNAIPTSAPTRLSVLALAVPSLAQRTMPCPSESSMAVISARQLQVSTTPAYKTPIVTVDVMEVSIAESDGTLIPEANGAPILSFFLPPNGPNPSEGPGFDVVLATDVDATKMDRDLTTLMATSTVTTTFEATPTIPVTASGTSRSDRIVFEFVALAALMILTGMLSSRVILIWPHRHLLFESGAQALRWLALTIPAFGLLFVLSSILLLDIWGDDTPSHCHAAITICIAFYFTVKMFEYIFMIERAHQLRRTRSITHVEDCWWLVELAGLVIGLGVIAVLAFTQPTTSLSSEDQICRIGLSRGVAITLLTFDIVLNIYLTLHYCIIAWRVSPFRSIREVFQYINAAIPFRGLKAGNNDQQALRKFQVGRVVLGLVFIILPTTANLAFMVYYRGHERGWLCFTSCTIDITWSVIVIHWLTSKPSYSVSTVRHLG